MSEIAIGIVAFIVGVGAALWFVIRVSSRIGPFK
jgi:hypothetical protein